jgi:hypothetical protein
MEHSMNLQLFADAGVPMIFLTMPAMMMLLIPIIIVEGLLCKKWLGLTTWQALKSNAVSNAASTVFGIPVAWGIMLGVEILAGAAVNRSQALHNWQSPLANVIGFLLGSAWIAPPERNVWMVPAATLVLLVPFFFASYLIEYFVLKAMVGVTEAGPSSLAEEMASNGKWQFGDDEGILVPNSRVRVAVRNANLITYGAMFIGAAIWLSREMLQH